MKIRIHGRLLMLTGIIHLVLVVMPGVYGEQFYLFSKQYFFYINKGLIDFPLFGGSINHEQFAAFWFFYGGVLTFMYGHLLDKFEKSNGHISREISRVFLFVALIGSYMIPMSGMTFVLLPQALYMCLRVKK